jgi:urea carboxylase
MLKTIRFKKVLIANRGAIAVRIIRTLHELGCKAVVIYHEADKHSLHVHHADESYSLGAGSVADTYLNQEKILTIAKQANAEAIHPGYGFLSENPDFSDACDHAGIVFLGPNSQQMKDFGLKHRARELAEQSNTPLLPGTDLLKDLDDATAQAASIGYPVMLKSTAGGGGIGMQLCYSEKELHNAFDSVKRLSANNFSNDGVFLEKFVEKARHIEVQIFGDGQGNVTAFGERDCSLQRRNQKVIEETPAPNISEATRKALHDTACRLGKSVNYRSAGTVEFIYDDASEAFYFLEVNTRLQVEHGVTEEVFNIDLVEWMIRLGAGETLPLNEKRIPVGHSIQARIYAEDPVKDFQPCAGLLSKVRWAKNTNNLIHNLRHNLRIDTWVENGTQVPALFDPMLAKVIVTADTREDAITQLHQALAESELYGIETNLLYVQHILEDQDVLTGNVWTRKLNELSFQDPSIDVISAGTQTTIQDVPGRIGYWNVGIPPSGPFDDYSFRLGNRLLGNSEDCAGLEITLQGPVLKFGQATQVIMTGAESSSTIIRNGEHLGIEFYQVINLNAGDILDCGSVTGAGARAFLLIAGGIQCPEYLGSRSTFTLGQFGGHNGRSLLPGDVLHLMPSEAINNELPAAYDANLIPSIGNTWEVHVIYGPHGAPDFFTDDDIDTFFDANWEVHFNSSRTGVRLIGPKPDWARADGGEAGLHPSNIHDNAYAIGAIDFTGDMPVILGPDGPSLGGFVCPATVIKADLWKLGQFKAGDKIKFKPVSHDTAVELANAQNTAINSLMQTPAYKQIDTPSDTPNNLPSDIALQRITTDNHPTGVVYRPAGDNYLLIEYGPLQLDIRLRFRVHALMESLLLEDIDGIIEMTPGIRSLQIHYDSLSLSRDDLLARLVAQEDKLGDLKNAEVPSRTVWLPLSWNDIACQQAVDKYVKSVRADAPWCPDNIEFIRRINGLDSIEDVKDIVFDASYLVMGLGDVYLGAPVATPVDPRHRLVTTKYNPARTWTAENSVGIGGAYMCVYGMEGPGGYQFIGRTLQMWNRHKQTKEFSQPWLLRFFDKIRFYEVSHNELTDIREEFPHGRYPIKIEEGTFNLDEYEGFLSNEAEGITAFQTQRQHAFQQELEDWKAKGLLRFETDTGAIEDTDERQLQDGEFAIESHISGNVWQVLVKPGQHVEAGQPLLILESMKMEIEITAHKSGTVVELLREPGQGVSPGKALVVLKGE